MAKRLPIGPFCMPDYRADFWIDFENSVVPSQAEAYVVATRLSAIEPLAPQPGAFPAKSIPDRLRPHLFPESFTQTRLYAVLDGAKIEDLPELLAASGLAHRCLFKGAAEEEYGAVAPWLVELDEDARLLRQLMTRSDAPQHLWDLEAAVYLHSASGLDAAWRHLRRFSQLQDERGRWTFFRFWQVDILLDLLLHDLDGKTFARSFMVSQHCRIDGIIGFDRQGAGALITLAESDTAEPSAVPRLEGRLSAALVAALRRRRARQIADMLRTDFQRELAGRQLSDLRTSVEMSLQRMQGYRFTALPLLYTLAAWELFYGPLDLIPDPEGQLMRTLTSHLSEQRKFRRLRDRLTQLSNAELIKGRKHDA